MQAKSAELDVARMELEELHSKVQQYESMKELLERQLKDTQVCVIHMSCNVTYGKDIICRHTTTLIIIIIILRLFSQLTIRNCYVTSCHAGEHRYN